MFAESAEKAVSLTRVLERSLPPSRISFIGIIIISFLIGAISGAAGVGGDALHGAIRAVFLIGVPAGLGAASCISLKRKIRYKQIMFLSFASALLYGTFYFLHFGGVLVGAGMDSATSLNVLLIVEVLLVCQSRDNSRGAWIASSRTPLDTPIRPLVSAMSNCKSCEKIGCSLGSLASS